MPTVSELKDQLREMGAKGYSKMRKSELEEMLAKLRAKSTESRNVASRAKALEQLRRVEAETKERNVKRKESAKKFKSYEDLLKGEKDVETILKVLWLMNNKPEFDMTKQADDWLSYNDSPRGEDWNDEYNDDISSSADEYVDLLIEVAKENKLYVTPLKKQMRELRKSGYTMFDDYLRRR
jgi:hypothetical protein